MQWLVRGGLGASLSGFGACAIVECGFLKHEGAPWLEWVGLGTLSLIAFNAGICLIADAVRFRIKMDEESA